MEIKRSLEKLAKRMSPQIEVMNVATEMRQSVKRLDELVTYAQTKIDRSIERKKKKAETSGAIADKARKRQDAIVLRAQQEESDKNQADQEEAFELRNQKPGGEVVTDDEDPGAGNVPIADEPVDPADEPTKRVVKDPPKPTKKKK